MNVIVYILQYAGKATLSTIDNFGVFLRHISCMTYLIVTTFMQIKNTFKVKALILKEIKISGIGSLLLVMAASAFIGGETVIQTQFQFSGIVPLRYLGMAVCKALITELSPVIVSFIVSSRISTSIAAEIGTMKISEQFDAMTCLNLNPIRYVVLPKLIACTIMLPVLVIIGEFVALIASIIIVLMSIDVTLYSYLQGIRLFFNPFDLFAGIIKSAVFGTILCFVGAYSGFQTRGGAEGVGKSTTNAVVFAALAILVVDFTIAFLLK